MSTGTDSPWSGWWRPNREHGRWHRVCHAESASEAEAILAAMIEEPGQTTVLPSHHAPRQAGRRAPVF